MVPQDGSSALDKGKAQTSSAHCLKDICFWGAWHLHSGCSAHGHRGAAVQELLLGCGSAQSCTSGSELLYQCWQGCSEVTGTAAIPHQSWLPLQLPKEWRQCWGFVACSAVPAPPTPFRFGDTWGHPLWLQWKLQGTHCLLSL